MALFRITRTTAMLGIDWLTANQANWDIAGGTITLWGKTHKLVAFPSANAWCRRIVLSHDLTVPAAEIDVPAQMICRNLGRQKPVFEVSWATEPNPITLGTACWWRALYSQTERLTSLLG